MNRCRELLRFVGANAETSAIDQRQLYTFTQETFHSQPFGIHRMPHP